MRYYKSYKILKSFENFLESHIATRNSFQQFRVIVHKRLSHSGFVHKTQ